LALDWNSAVLTKPADSGIVEKYYLAKRFDTHSLFAFIMLVILAVLMISGSFLTTTSIWWLGYVRCP
jgi:hypothetical protein